MQDKKNCESIDGIGRLPYHYYYFDLLPLDDPPVCEILPAPENGFIRSNTSRETEFDCNEGYRLFGSRTRSCSRDNGWEGVQPTCYRKLIQNKQRNKNKAEQRNKHP